MHGTRFQLALWLKVDSIKIDNFFLFFPKFVFLTVIEMRKAILENNVSLPKILGVNVHFKATTRFIRAKENNRTVKRTVGMAEICGARPFCLMGARYFEHYEIIRQITRALPLKC